jgi:hypothetical protein
MRWIRLTQIPNGFTLRRQGGPIRRVTPTDEGVLPDRLYIVRVRTGASHGEVRAFVTRGAPPGQRLHVLTRDPVDVVGSDVPHVVLDPD